MSQDASLHKLLRYEEKYSVLICRECQYAIQKNAIDSHLLRHKIYRVDRRRILAAVAQLKILEPEKVPTPPTDSSPIDGLPILAGLQCSAHGCRLLCVSTKRMRRHWNEAHPQQGGDDPRQRLAFDVQLQTFFRGTKLRYFVVNVSSSNSTAILPEHDSTDTVPDGTETPSITDASPQPCLTVDLDVLKYFQHFTKTTSLTLPAMGPTSPQYWQTEAIGVALDNTNLMGGILAVSAAHAFVLSSDDQAKKLHELAFQHFNQQFDTTKFLNPASSVHDTNDQVFDGLASKVARQVHSITTMVHWSTLFPQTSTPPPTSFSLQSFITTFQGCLSPMPRPIQDQLLSSAPTLDRSSVTGSDALSASMARLHGLPFRMTNVFGRPEHPLDIVTLIAAVDILLDCYSKAYAGTDPNMIWLAAVHWLGRMSDHFHGLLAGNFPPALVVFAHAVPLFRLAEHSYWFLSGISERLLKCVYDQLPRDDAKVMALVQGILDDESTDGSEAVERDTNYSTGSFLC